LGERVIITSDLKPIKKQCEGISEEEAKHDWVGEIVSINDPEHLGRVGVCCCPSRNVHYVFPFQIFTLSDTEEYMHEEYISESDMDDYVVIDDEAEDNEDGEYEEYKPEEVEEIDLMDVDDDDEWETEDSEWETESDEDMINDNEDGPRITEITSDNEQKDDGDNEEGEEEEETNNESIDEKIKAVLKTTEINDNDTTKLKSFILLEDPPENHHFIDNENSTLNKSFYKTIMKEHKLLSTELPEGEIVVAAFSSRLELLRAIIFGPKDTIYEGKK